ncbi:ABC-type transport system ATP-binding protein (probable substrate cobalamin) [Natronomonas pharaonis DSM 2160]|uniref:Cobalamin import ATP-binding protein BtuD n=1 Tax=Natronomonas pharaonis (strain ATCC 35678 / DSM 2160 / CIP 103997 / JCM 8858 / NBRC 14720 / NCIMB 2260 / Gabara) TaxID=348780 RepID=A0A1U7EXS6_NATPD|nr:heme ABC transporter ATP-binding protein [Natronomonas pharaonis]CAI50000.1 ABC-type transport system ATP-binding protein (probable substrate cobalamin) [Natronomonas pharaonis DSM 2160]
MISLSDVVVEFGETTVLDGVSLSVEEGEFLALVGPNGAGKTTLLRTCNGVLTPAAGTVTVAGRDVAATSARELGRQVATVPQETTLAFEFDVEAVVRMGRTPHRSRLSPADSAGRAAVESALERTETAAFADRSIDSLSGGERQRVMLARALAQATPVLLLDEPTASLDINHQVRTLALARELADDGKTVVAAIHDLELAARFCDTVALLSDGRILDSGRPEAVLTAERLEAAFGVRTAVGTNPVTGSPSVTPLADAPPDGQRVHVLGAGQPAARLLGDLAERGIDVTAGPLPTGDVAAATAGSVGREAVTAPPFKPVSESDIEAATDLIEAADVTVLAGRPAGPTERLTARSERLLALPGTDAPPSAHIAAPGDIVDALEDPTRRQTSSSAVE